jgi:hypothetical protein
MAKSKKKRNKIVAIAVLIGSLLVSLFVPKDNGLKTIITDTISAVGDILVSDSAVGDTITLQL